MLSHPGLHRLYGEAEWRRIWFSLPARELGFSIEELRSLLGLVDGDDYTCGEVRDLTLRHLAGVGTKIAAFRRLEGTLAEVSSQCDGGTVPECPIIDALFGIDSSAEN